MKHAFTFILTMLGAASNLPAVENASAAAFEPPKKYGAERYITGWERNPFAAPSAPTVMPTMDSPFKDLAIKSVYGPKDSPVFSLVNTKTHERVRLSMDKPTQNGIALKSFHLADNRKDTTIEVAKGSENATLKYAIDYVPPAPHAQVKPGVIPGTAGATNTVGRIPLPQVSATPASSQPASRPGMPAGTPANQRIVPAPTGAMSANSAFISEPATRRRLLTVPSGTGEAANGTTATIDLNAPAANPVSSPITQPTNTTPAMGEITPPIVRPPPSIYLDGSR
jgi:hypothetical protein